MPPRVSHTNTEGLTEGSQMQKAMLQEGLLEAVTLLLLPCSLTEAGTNA